MRAKHGQYDATRHLPNNCGQAVGSGRVIWLQEQIQASFPHLLAASLHRGSSRTQWLLFQLEAMEDQKAQKIAQEYRQRARRDALIEAQRKRYRTIRKIQTFQSTISNEQEQRNCAKRIASIQRQIDKATCQHGALLTTQEIEELLAPEQ